MVFVLIGVAAHPVWLGYSLSYMLGYRAHLFPTGGYCDFAYDAHSPNLCGGPKLWAYHLVLPWITFAFLFAALYARMIRASVLETMDEDYVRTARAKGASEWRVLRSHVLRNALMPVVTMLGMDMVVISLTGVIFIETVFQLPGIGTLLYRSLTDNDLPVILGIVIVISVTVTIANMIVGHRLLPPRSAGEPSWPATAARLGHEPVAFPASAEQSPRRLRRAEPVRPGVLVVRAGAGADDASRASPPSKRIAVGIESTS